MQDASPRADVVEDGEEGGVAAGVARPAGPRRAGFAHPGADRGGPVDWAGLRRVLLVRPDNLGDVVVLTPAVRAVRAAAPSARIDLLASPAGSALLPLVPELDGVLTASPSWQRIVGAGTTPPVDSLADAERDLVAEVAGRGYDAAVVFTSPTQSPWPAAHVALLAGVEVRVAQSAEFGGALATHWVTPPPGRTHQVDRSLHLLAAVGVPPAGRAPALRVPAPARRAAAAAVAAAGLAPGSPFALLAPGASCSSRRYPADRFGAAARSLAERGLPVLVTGTAAEAPLVAAVVDGAAHPGVRPLPVLDVPGLAGAVELAAVALTNDSGGMHLADALRTPVAVAFSGTERAGDIGPRATRSVLLGRRVECSPCRQFTCPFGHECLDVDPAALAAAAAELAAAPRVPRSEELLCPTPRLTVPLPAVAGAAS